MLGFRGPDHSSSLPVLPPWGGRVAFLLDESGRRNKGNFLVLSDPVMVEPKTPHRIELRWFQCFHFSNGQSIYFWGQEQEV